MDSTQICIFKKSHQICLTCFLQPHHGRSLDSHFCVSLFQYFIHQPLEWTFSNQKFCALLVMPYFSQSNCAWPPSSLLSWWIYWWLSWGLSSNWWSSHLHCSVGSSIGAFPGSLLGSCRN